jgi:hypothetical protein
MLTRTRKLGIAATTGVVALLASAAIAVGPASADTSTLQTKLTQAEAEAMLSGAGITWSSTGGCSDRDNPTCTSFEQINEATVQGIITFEGASGCAINITGGTETGHADGQYSHWNGYKVDISRDSCPSSYITSTFTYIGDRPGDGAPQYQSAAGNIYADEGNHWDILYYNCGGC